MDKEAKERLEKFKKIVEKLSIEELRAFKTIIQDQLHTKGTLF